MNGGAGFIFLLMVIPYYLYKHILRKQDEKRAEQYRIAKEIEKAEKSNRIDKENSRYLFPKEKEEELRAFISDPGNYDEIYEEIGEDLRYAFGDDFRDKFILGSNEMPNGGDPGEHYIEGPDFWALQLLVAKCHGLITWYGYLCGYMDSTDCHGTSPFFTRSEVTKLARCINAHLKMHGSDAELKAMCYYVNRSEAKTNRLRFDLSNVYRPEVTGVFYRARKI